MATINTLLRTLTVSQHFCRNAPLTGVGGDPTEPAMSIGDWVRNFMLQPPFAWRWNRATTTISATTGQQDYSVALANFGWLESATVNDLQAKPNSITSMEVQLNLDEDLSGSGPRYIAARLDDDAGNITFRVHPVPEANCSVIATYQKASPTFATLSDTWAPLPDYMSNIYSMGFLAKAYEYFDDPRYAFTFQMFLRQLLAASEGLDESQKNIFISQFIDTARDQRVSGMRSQMGHQGRGGA